MRSKGRPDARTPSHPRAHRRAHVDYGVERTIAQISLFLTIVVLDYRRNWGARMPTDDSLIDEIIAACNGDLRAAIRSVLVINEQRRAELKWLRDAAQNQSSRATDSGPVIH
jgi:replication-associated recombination protein RarA